MRESNDYGQFKTSTANGTSRRTYLSVFGLGSLALGSGTVSAGTDDRAGSNLGRSALHGQGATRNSLAKKFKMLSRETEWKRLNQHQVNFDTHHPQGMSNVGEEFFLSSVEVLELPGRYTKRDDDNDDPGRGVGHLFKMDVRGQLLDSIELGDGAIYHPGGIDFDGEYLWVPVAEYRPDSRSIIYRVDPDTLEATPVFRVADHIGGVIFDTDSESLYGLNWGSRTFYRWRLSGSGEVINQNKPLAERAMKNPEHYVDYQDCQYIGDGLAMCSGMAGYQPPNTADVKLGGIDLVDLRSAAPIYQVPVTEWTDDGLVMTRNPFLVKERSNGLRFYFLPEDDTSYLFVYDVKTS
ncbi:DUF6454 family protein [Haladaptatus salinisoli]|uniref:DUF6454 family protein n=1 Tax=Haladaptatus salinisoli TaxID=2884876 RepID=UPI001D0AEFE9|nr:DUF6454 family protein [Haladaptatus salinisoli]